MNNYSWHVSLLKDLLRLRQRMPHALLIRGREGVGELELALDLAQSLLCEKPAEDGLACGNCPACGWFSKENHPDFRLIQPDAMASQAESEEEAGPQKKSDQIRIEQIRALQDFLAVGTHRAGFRVIVVHPADRMNGATQNALLKGLEEPPPATVFLLVTSQPQRLLPTVRSRCRDALIALPEKIQALEWMRENGGGGGEAVLALAGGAPLAAVALAEAEPVRRRLLESLKDRKFDVIGAADICLKADTPAVVGWLQRWAYDLLASNLSAGIRYHHDEEDALHRLGSGCDPVRIAGFLRDLAQARALARHPLNPKLFIEDLLVRYRILIGGQ